jgi:hypothetical protein
VSYLNLTLSYWGGEGILAERREASALGLIELRGGGGEWPRLVRGDEGHGRPFYRHPGKGKSGGWRAPARCTVAAIMVTQWW